MHTAREVLRLIDRIKARNVFALLGGGGGGGEPTITAGTTGQYWRGDKTFQTLNKAAVGLANVDNVSDADKPISTLTATALSGKQASDAELTALAGLVSAANKIPRFTGSGTASLLDFSVDGTLAGNSDTTLVSQKAIKTYVDQIVAAQDAMVFKGIIDCSASPNYPAADRGHTYRVSVAGKIGGAAGLNMEAGDILLCLTDATAAGNHATVGASWGVIQVNIDGAVISGGALGTPSSGSLANCNGLPLSGVSSLQSELNLKANLTGAALVTPSLSAPTFSVAAGVTAGTAAQGQGALTSDVNVITTAAASPSGVTLPTATAGRWVVVINRGANAINVYPATGASIDGITANLPVSIPSGAMLEFMAQSTTAWFSTQSSANPILLGTTYFQQRAQASIAAAATMTIAQLLTGIIQYTGVAAALTLPTGTLIDASVMAGLAVDRAFEFVVVNTGSGAATITTAAGLTLVGAMAVTNGTSARFCVRKTAANTFTVYRAG